jgi:hypothetical protein
MITIERDKYLRIYETFYDAYKTSESCFNNYVDLSKYEISSSVTDRFEWKFVFYDMATESVRELLGEINEFYSYIEYLAAWSKVIEGSSEDDLLEIHSFMRPVAYAAINSPNCIKNRFLHYSVVLLRETITLCLGRNLKCYDFSDNAIKSRTLSAFEQPAKELDLKSFGLFLSKRDSINQKHFIEGSSNFRNRYHHQRPPHVEIGLVSLARREEDIASEFSKYRFNKVCTIEKLCETINSDSSELSLKEPNNTIERLNEILRIVNLYDMWLKKAEYIKKMENRNIKRLAEKTSNYRTKHFAQLSLRQQQNILKLNRLILESVYPECCPKVAKDAYSFGGEQPITISKLLPLLLSEHQASIETFNAFWQLLLEQIEIWKQKSKRPQNEA